MDTTAMHPDLVPLCEKFFALCVGANIKAQLNHPVWRSPEAQQALYDKGLSNAPAGKGKHEFELYGLPASKAFDFSLFTPAGKYITDGTDPLYAKAGVLGESIGLHWGGRWHHPDWDHFEI